MSVSASLAQLISVYCHLLLFDIGLNVRPAMDRCPNSSLKTSCRNKLIIESNQDLSFESTNAGQLCLQQKSWIQSNWHVATEAGNLKYAHKNLNSPIKRRKRGSTIVNTWRAGALLKGGFVNRLLYFASEVVHVYAVLIIQQAVMQSIVTTYQDERRTEYFLYTHPPLSTTPSTPPPGFILKIKQVRTIIERNIEWILVEFVLIAALVCFLFHRNFQQQKRILRRNRKRSRRIQSSLSRF